MAWGAFLPCMEVLRVVSFANPPHLLVQCLERGQILVEQMGLRKSSSMRSCKRPFCESKCCFHGAILPPGETMFDLRLQDTYSMLWKKTMNILPLCWGLTVKNYYGTEIFKKSETFTFSEFCLRWERQNPFLCTLLSLLTLHNVLQVLATVQ